jgi:hypothetical protein
VWPRRPTGGGSATGDAEERDSFVEQITPDFQTKAFTEWNSHGDAYDMLVTSLFVGSRRFIGLPKFV